jgi:hypothetical protein
MTSMLVAVLLSSFLSYSSNLKMEETCSSKLLFTFNELRCVSYRKSRLLYNRGSDSLISYIYEYHTFHRPLANSGIVFKIDHDRFFAHNNLVFSIIRSFDTILSYLQGGLTIRD